MPYYLHIGMTPSDYWEGPAYLCVAYREKARLDAELSDAMAWQQGSYVYESLINLAPMFGFNKGKTKEYPSKPHSFDSKKVSQERDVDSKISSGKAFMEAFAARHNAAMRERSKDL